jgi:hypothetical protein
LPLSSLTLGLSSVSRADELMTECMVTASEKMCQCNIGRIRPTSVPNAILGLRKSNQSVSVSGNLLNPSTCRRRRCKA